MAFSLGNFTIDEVIMGAAEVNDELKFVLDQLSSAQIEISSDSTDITDKRGNIVRKIYKTKTGTFTATNAFLNPYAMNAQSGSEIELASDSNKIQMPKMEEYTAGSAVVLDDGYVDGTVKVIGIYKDGGNSVALTQSTTAAFDETPTFGYNSSTKTITLPAAADGAPVSYVIKYERKVDAGMALKNKADVFATSMALTLYCSIVDPCSDTLRAGYVYIPSFQPSPETTISLNSDEQEFDFNGDLQVSYCGAEKLLYAIYFPDEDAVTTAVAA